MNNICVYSEIAHRTLHISSARIRQRHSCVCVCVYVHLIVLVASVVWFCVYHSLCAATHRRRVRVGKTG